MSSDTQQVIVVLGALMAFALFFASVKWTNWKDSKQGFFTSMEAFQKEMGQLPRLPRDGLCQQLGKCSRRLVNNPNSKLCRQAKCPFRK